MPLAARHRVMMKRVTREPARWAGIKAHLEGETGAGIHDANLTNLLGELLKAGFLRRGGDLYSVAERGSAPSFYLTHDNLLRI
jgi:hypothetical protein